MFQSDIVQIKQYENEGRGLYLKKQIKKGQTILQINRKYFITYDQLIEYYHQIDQIITERRFKFAYCLAIQYQLKNQSKYFQYLQSVPATYTNPIMFNTQIIKQFQNLKLVQKLLKKLTIIHENYQKISQTQFAKKYPVGLQFVKIAYALVESRTLYYKTKKDPKSEVGVLVPFYDMANHSEQVNQQNIYEYFTYVTELDSYILKAYKNMQKGQQVFISYGSYNNSHFVEFYGFIPKGNKNLIEMQLVLDPRIIFQQAKLELLQMFHPQLLVKNKKKLQLRKPIILCLDENGQIINEMIIDILSLSTIKKSKKQLYNLINQQNYLKSIINKEFKKQILRETFKKYLSQYKINNEKEIQHQKKNSNQYLRLAQQFRLREKKQIEIAQLNYQLNVY